MLASESKSNRSLVSPWGIYLHVPFCAKLCLYCDFAKTARFADDEVARYLDTCKTEWSKWLDVVDGTRIEPKASTLFFGGGTPGLFTNEYEPLLVAMRKRMNADAEFTIEANPENVTEESLASFKRLGVNRLSMGVQTFSESGLKILGRDHSSQSAINAAKRALEILPNVNIDLIYGWKGQTLEDWRADLQQAISLGIPHLSLYTLTFEPNTPLGRGVLRRKQEWHDDEKLEAFYNTACDMLHDAGFDHEEISNWSKPGYSCAHNWLYWRNQPYIAVGAGAHGCIPILDEQSVPQNWRYQNDKHWRKYMIADVAVERGTIGSFVTPNEWAMDHVGCSLRTMEGVSISFLREASGREETWRPSILKLLERGAASIENQRFKLAEREWFREQHWAVEILLSFRL